MFWGYKTGFKWLWLENSCKKTCVSLVFFCLPCTPDQFCEVVGGFSAQKSFHSLEMGGSTHGCHLAIKIWPFWNGLPFFGFFGLLKKVHCKACFGEICGKDALFYKILILNLVILTNF